jgi:OOP family OmpA-OmpF porin
MKKTIITSAAFLITLVSINAQDKKEKVEKGFNRLSVEFNAGPNKAIKPFAAGYSSSNEGKLNAISANHYDLGLRYMLTTRFGLKFDLANDKFTNQSGSSSLPFETQQYRIGLQGVVNAGRIMGFEDFTKSIGLLAHGGIQVSQFTSNMGVNDGVSELNGGIMFGVTPQIRITNKLVFTADLTVLSNVRQHLNWDGSTSDQANNLTGQMFNTDRDGIVDHLDTENNTPTGVTVDSKGRFIDANKNGTPDELEPKDVKDGKDGNTSVAQSDAIKMLIEKGFVNVFYDVNKDLPNTGSMNNVYYIIKFLKAYPETKATLSGSTDLNGSEAKNIGLSQRRAQNLYNVIIANGVDASRVSVLGNGVDKEYTTDSATGLGLARRVSISLE